MLRQTGLVQHLLMTYRYVVLIVHQDVQFVLVQMGCWWLHQRLLMVVQELQEFQVQVELAELQVQVELRVLQVLV
jgi:hypothetical protein